jgi:predicted metal-binding membrane protein
VRGEASVVPLSLPGSSWARTRLFWTLFGVLAYLGANAASELAQRIPWLMMNATRVGGGILVVAGLYQFTPVKRACLAKCCMRQQFIRDGWRDGRAGVFRLGLAHGLYCLGANWLLCVLLFALGLMNIAAMAVLTGLIFAEKVFPRAERIAWIAGLALILYGMLLIAVPAALPLNGAGM